MWRAIFLILISPVFFLPAFGQDTQISNVTENILRARTKQIHQFIRRFNSEEGPDGQKYFTDHPKYRDEEQRLKYLPYLFDKQTDNFSDSLKNAFITDVVADSTPQYIDFHDKKWFAETKAHFSYKNTPANVTFFLNLVQSKKGYKWIFQAAYNEKFAKIFNSNKTKKDTFIHPMSHEVDFMNFKNIFADKANIESYTYDSYHPDFLTLFFYQLKKGNFTFKYVKNVTFHFFQVKNWYFEVSNIQRKGKNAGWLITNLIKIPEKNKVRLKQTIQYR